MINDWLESHWLTPAYAGWILLGIGLSFFGAATNTMAGWLYLLSGMIFAILALNGFIALKNLKNIEIKRFLVNPVSAGDFLIMELEIKNLSNNPKILFQVIDQLPIVLSKKPVMTSIETIAAKGSYDWVYTIKTTKRGVFHWQDIDLKTAAPLGVLYCKRSKVVPIKAIVYPQVLPLKNCPLIDTIGSDQNIKQQSKQLFISSTEGITKAIRPYRFGDPTRLIHWRSSARFGDFQVRELEIITGGEEVIIALDNSTIWDENLFEEAVIAAASLYFYASRCQLEVKLWTAQTGLIHGNRVVLETLASIDYTQNNDHKPPFSLPLIWLCQDTSSFNSLSTGSRWFLFPSSDQNSDYSMNNGCHGIIYNSQETLEKQLQKPL